MTKLMVNSKIRPEKYLTRISEPRYSSKQGEARNTQPTLIFDGTEATLGSHVTTNASTDKSDRLLSNMRTCVSTYF